ncbi:abscisic acid and environmental stress-inducible protein-like, partial [Ctenocephalides felis]|uniref:abscisic acid and environmental stress-inducible protein-like n=1 Tax=Ctenocephalides felis TaxID=7515 RepID=UPI000E6E1D24
MVPWRGRLGFRQYIPGKRHKYGVKLYKLCLSEGYTHNIEIYADKNGTMIEKCQSQDVSTDDASWGDGRGNSRGGVENNRGGIENNRGGIENNRVGRGNNGVGRGNNGVGRGNNGGGRGNNGGGRGNNGGGRVKQRGGRGNYRADNRGGRGSNHGGQRNHRGGQDVNSANSDWQNKQEAIDYINAKKMYEQRPYNFVFKCGSKG